MLGSGRGKRATRREPRFDAHPEELLEVRLRPEDRPGGGGRRFSPERAVEPRRRPDPLGSDDEPPPLPRRRRAHAQPDRETEPEMRLDEDDDRDLAQDQPVMSRNRRSGYRRDGRRRGGGSVLGGLVKWGLIAAIWALVAFAGLLAYEAQKLPPINALQIPPRPPSITLVGIDGTVLATRGEGAGGQVKLKNLPPFLPKAFIAVEDRRFRHHWGVDPVGLVRAIYTNLRSGEVMQGGSTLTQQLAKNLFLTPERSIERKLQELILAVWLETKFSKNQILELYLNRVYFGSGAYGVEAAAQRYFNKPASNVTLAEAAILAGLVKAPSRLAPTKNPQAAEARAQVVLAAMAEERIISEADAARAMILPAAVAPPRPDGSAGYAADWVVDQLGELIGHFERDIVVDTTIDPILQAEAEQALVQELAENGSKLGVSQGAVVAIDPTGAVRALVGGRSYAQSQYNRAVTAKRQPGSAFKPFVYLAALERGYAPETLVQDAPLQLKGWSPENFDRKYRGPVRLSQALALSLNTVSVRLALDVGPKTVVATARRLGVGSPLQANPSIALGTSEVSPLELAGAFAPFSNGGYGVLPYVVKRVRTAGKGQVLYERKGSGLGQVLRPEHVGAMNLMLGETLRVGTAKKAEIGQWPAAGKTGTSQDFRDAWFVGYTAHLVTAVWLGNDDNSPTRKASGSNVPVEIWSRFMTAAHQGVPIVELPGVYRPTMMAQDPGHPLAPLRAGHQGGDDPWRPTGPNGEGPLTFLKRLFGG